MLSRILPGRVSRYFYGAPSQEDYYHPIKFLPPELLQEIFVFAASSRPARFYISPDEPRNPAFTMTPFYISRVCSDWRTLSFSTPEMWSWMTVSVPSKLALKLVQYHLCRTGTYHGLKLYFRDSPDLPPLSPPSAERRRTLAIFDLWLSEAHRWTSIDFEFETTPPMQKLINLTPGSLNRLSSVRVRLPPCSWPKDGAQRLYDTIHMSPALRDVEWPHVLRKIPGSAPLMQLTSVAVDRRVSWTEFFTLLSVCTRLRKIDVRVVPITEIEATSTMPTLLLPFLETLWLHYDTREDESRLLLNYIRAPNLQNLHTTASCSDSAVLQRFLARSGCRLRTLWLQGIADVQTEEMVLVDCLLQAAPHLADLRMCKLRHRTISVQTVSALSPQTVDGVTSVLLPSLTHLLLIMVEIPDGIIGNMLLSRARQGCIPCSVVIHFLGDRIYHPRDEELSLQLRDYGCDAVYC